MCSGLGGFDGVRDRLAGANQRPGERLAVHDKCVGHRAGHKGQPCRQRFHKRSGDAVVEGRDCHVYRVAFHHCRFGDGPQSSGRSDSDLYCGRASNRVGVLIDVLQLTGERVVTDRVGRVDGVGKRLVFIQQDERHHLAVFLCDTGRRAGYEHKPVGQCFRDQAGGAVVGGRDLHPELAARDNRGRGE